MIARDERWLEQAFEQATHRVALPPSDRWLPRRRSKADREVGAESDNGLRRLLLAGVVLAGLVAALLYATQMSARPAPNPSGVLNPPPATHLFTPADADRIILQFTEPPSGMRQVATASGATILTYPFGGEECAGMALPDGNFVGGEVTQFEQGQFGDPTYRFLGSWAVVYGDAQSASDALHTFARCMQLTRFPGQDPVDPKLGAEGVVFTGAPAPMPDSQAAMYMWRVDNLLMNVLLNGPAIEWRDAEEVARLMTARATARAK